jgi:hypothetical protein
MSSGAVSSGAVPSAGVSSGAASPGSISPGSVAPASVADALPEWARIAEEPGYDFGGATFDLEAPLDRQVLRFILSQALFGEATGVYCGRSLYSARSLEAARFYVRQARQELGHLQLFADILRSLELEPEPPHPVIRRLSAHNHYYPLKVLMEHAVGEGMVLDIFKDLLLQTLPDSDPRVPAIKKKLRVVCREEAEHVAWGEKETRLLLRQKPWLKTPYFGLIELQLRSLPLIVRGLRQHQDHPVLRQVNPFVEHVSERVRRQARALGIYPEEAPKPASTAVAMVAGVGLYLRSQLARGSSQLDKTYLRELGFGPKPS